MRIQTLIKRIERAEQAAQTGGRRQAVCDLGHANEIRPPKTATELRDLLAQSIVEVRTGRMDSKTANSISHLGTGLLRAIEVTESEAEWQAGPGVGRPQFAYQVYEASWLLENKARWAAELEKKYADQFQSTEPSGGAA